MRPRGFSSTLTAFALLGSLAGAAQAQYGYPGGYGGFGWGGWGATTAQGDIARGLGMFNMGTGVGNLYNAEANAVNTQTTMAWNQAVWNTQTIINNQYAYLMQRRKGQVDRALAQTYDRLKNHPEMRDIENGSALNVQLDILTNPSVSGSVYRTIKTPVPKEVVRGIPFQLASEGLTMCLARLTGEDLKLPLALRDSAYATERDAAHKAIDAALKEDLEGDLSSESVNKVSNAIAALTRKFQATCDQNSPDYIPAMNFLKAASGVTKMLRSERMREVMAEVEKCPGATLGELIGFMQAFNLRFGVAKTPRQQQIYQQLLPILTEAVNGGPVAPAAAAAEKNAKTAAEQGEVASNKAGDKLGSAANDFFKGMGWEHVDSQAKPRAPAPPKPQN